MRKQNFFQLLITLVCMMAARANCQDTMPLSQPIPVAGKVITFIQKKAQRIDKAFSKSTERYLSRLQKKEFKIRQKIGRLDPSLARQLFDGVEQQYEALKQTSPDLSRHSQVYSGHLDSLTTALEFFNVSKADHPELHSAFFQVCSLQDKFDQAEAICNFLSERKRLLKANLEKLGILKSLKGFQKQAYYYSAQVRAYKELWEDPHKLEKKLLEVLAGTEAFKDFFREHSQLASLFALPGSNTAIASLAGLQTRASVQQALQDRFGSGPQVQQMLQQNLQLAQEQLNEPKSTLLPYSNGGYGNSNGDIDLPEGFKSNGQKTKTFLQRLEYGVNIQSQRARSYFPTTSDLGMSLGYKLNDNSSIGMGVSYKLGWGRGWDHIRITSEGVGLRSYLDVKLKGSLYFSGGYEQNYRTAFYNVQQLRNLGAWQRSGLIGLSKKYNVTKKLKGDMKLLWDFLSYQQVLRTQAILFRVGYNLK